MTVNKIFELGLIDDNTEIWIRDDDFNILAHGNRQQDDVLGCSEREVGSFSWQDDNKLYIDLKGEDLSEQPENG